MARQAWPDKVLWINWPSAAHLEPVAQVKTTTKQILEEAAPGNGFLIGITEDVPPDRWQENFLAIMETIEENRGMYKGVGYQRTTGVSCIVKKNTLLVKGF